MPPLLVHLKVKVHIIGPVISILFGCGLILFRERFARSSVESSARIFKMRRTQFLHESSKWTALLFGAGFVVAGVVSLLIVADSGL